MRKTLCALFSLMLILLTACSAAPNADEDDTLQIVVSAYPSYDFARQVAGEHAELRMLTRPGVDPHEYEPTPQNIIDIETCDIFIYNGGESDVWVDELLESVENRDIRIVRMMDCVTLLETETVEGMEHEAHDHADESHEYDEHVWLAPQNVIAIADEIRRILGEVDPEHAAQFDENAADFTAELEELDAHIRDVVTGAARQTIVFADRFPARYFTEAYGLTYYAAFPGCSSQTEPSAATVAFLIDKIRAENIPCVFTVPYSATTLPDTIAEETGAEIVRFDALHNVGSDDVGVVTYVDVMYENAAALARALG